jgi:hypothetical protein
MLYKKNSRKKEKIISSERSKTNEIRTKMRESEN